MNLFCFYSSLLGYIISVCGSENNMVTIRLREDYEIIVDISDEDLRSSLLYRTEISNNMEKVLKNRNVFVVLTFLGLVVGENYADSFFKEHAGGILSSSDTGNRIVNRNASELCKNYLHLFGQRVKSFSTIVSAFQNEFSHYIVLSSKEKSSVGPFGIPKQSFINELMSLLYLLYEYVGLSVNDRVNRYDILFSDTNTDVEASMQYITLVKVYTNFVHSFVSYTPPSVILQCELVFPKILAMYFGVKLLDCFALRPDSSLETVFVGSIENYEINNGERDIKAIEISVTRKFTQIYRSTDQNNNIHILLPVLLSHFDAVHLALRDYYVNFEDLLLLRNMVKKCRITRLVASIFDLDRFSFHAFVRETEVDRGTVVILDLSGSILADIDLQTLSRFSGLRRLVLPRNIVSGGALSVIFSENSRICQTLVELVYDQKVTDGDLNLLKRCPYLKYDGIVSERLFSADDADIDQYKDQIAHLLLQDTRNSDTDPKLLLSEYFSEFFYLNKVTIRSDDPQILESLSHALIKRPLTVRLENVGLKASAFLQAISHEMVMNVILEKVSFSHTESESPLDEQRNIILRNLTMIKCELEDQKMSKLLSKIGVEQILEIKRCKIDMQIIKVMVEKNRVERLTSLILDRNKMSNLHEVNIQQLVQLTKIKIILNEAYREPKAMTNQLCCSHTKTDETKRVQSPVSDGFLITMLGLTRCVDLERLEITITKDNCDLVMNHLSMAPRLNHLTLHIQNTDVDVGTILETNKAIQSLTIHGNDTYAVNANDKQSSVESTCREIKLVGINIHKPDLFQYIVRLKNLEKFDISKSSTKFRCFKRVRMFQSCRSQALLVFAAYSDDLVTSLISSDSGSVKRSRFSILTD